MKWLLRYHVDGAPDLKALRATFPEHQALWQTYRDRGTLLAIGPCADPADGAFGIFTDENDAREFATRDPFVTRGLVSRWELFAWREALLP